MIDIAVIDYGMGNLRSVSKAVEHVAPGLRVVVTSDPDEVRGGPARGVPRPGCDARLHARARRARSAPGGAGGGAQQALPRHLHRSADAVRTSAKKAMWRVWACSPGEWRAFPPRRWSAPTARKLKVPHMGWNEVHQTLEHPLWEGIADGQPLLLRAQLLSGAAQPRADRRLQPVPVCRSPVRSRRIICSRCSFTRRRARPRVCGCCPISCTGMVPMLRTSRSAGDAPGRSNRLRALFLRASD